MVHESVTDDEIATIISRWTGIPVAKLTESERNKTLNLDKELHKRVVGQDEGVEKVTEAIIRSKAGIKDPTKPIVKKVPTEFEKYDYSLCIVDTKGDHVDLTDDYAMIPSEMKKVANFLGEDYLRDCDSNEFYIRLDEIREAVGDRPVLRAIHFFNEEYNVKNAVSSLENGKFVEFLDAIRKSGNSSFKYLQNVYTTRDIQHQNISVALALSESLLRNYGVCRVHGGGFAGTIQAFVKNDFVSNYKEFINKIFGENSCHVLKVRKYGGIKVM